MQVWGFQPSMLDQIYHSIDPIAFTIGPLSVRWYGIAYVLGFIAAGFMMWWIAKRWHIRFNFEAITTILCCVIIGIILGARLGYCLFYGNGYYFIHPLEIFAVNQGGMSFHGGLMGALISGIVAAKLTKIPYLTLADMGAIAAPIGIFLVRCTNFINGELWGAQTDGPWGVVFGGSAGMVPRHPSQLYEAFLEGLLLFLILFLMARKRPPFPRGVYLGTFLSFYGVCRFLIEFVRQPDLQLGYLWGGWLTMGQLLSVPLIVAGIILIVWALKAKKPQEGLPLVPSSKNTETR